MNISQIAAELNIQTALDFTRATDKEDKPTQFLKCWDNDTRTGYVIHEEHMEVINTSDKLAFRKKEKEGKKGKFTQITIWETKADKEILLTIAPAS